MLLDPAVMAAWIALTAIHRRIQMGATVLVAACSTTPARLREHRLQHVHHVNIPCLMHVGLATCSTRLPRRAASSRAVVRPHRKCSTALVKIPVRARRRCEHVKEAHARPSMRFQLVLLGRFEYRVLVYASHLRWTLRWPQRLEFCLVHSVPQLGNLLKFV